MMLRVGGRVMRMLLLTVVSSEGWIRMCILPTLFGMVQNRGDGTETSWWGRIHRGHNGRKLIGTRLQCCRDGHRFISCFRSSAFLRIIGSIWRDRTLPKLGRRWRMTGHSHPFWFQQPGRWRMMRQRHRAVTRKIDRWWCKGI